MNEKKYFTKHLNKYEPLSQSLNELLLSIVLCILIVLGKNKAFSSQ